MGNLELKILESLKLESTTRRLKQRREGVSLLTLDFYFLFLLFILFICFIYHLARGQQKCQKTLQTISLIILIYVNKVASVWLEGFCMDFKIHDLDGFHFVWRSKFSSNISAVLCSILNQQ